MRFLRKYRLAAATGLLLAGGIASPAAAETFSFRGVSGGDFGNAAQEAADIATGQSQITVDVEAYGTSQSQVAFTFRNVGPNASSITAVYFDDGRGQYDNQGRLRSYNTDLSTATGIQVDEGSLAALGSLTETSGVNFTQASLANVNPADLPNGVASPQFLTTALFSADTDSPTQPNGVNATTTGAEALTVIFSLTNGKTVADVINEMNAALNPANVSGGLFTVANLRIGIHVQGYGSGNSEWFVNGPPKTSPPPPPPPPPAVPLPAVAWVGMALMGGVGARRGLAKLTQKKA